jgi:hypothetical protein
VTAASSRFDLVTAITADGTYLGMGNWGESPAITYEYHMMLASLHQQRDGRDTPDTIIFTEDQLKVLYEILKNRFET